MSNSSEKIVEPPAEKIKSPSRRVKKLLDAGITDDIVYAQLREHLTAEIVDVDYVDGVRVETRRPNYPVQIAARADYLKITGDTVPEIGAGDGRPIVIMPVINIDGRPARFEVGD